MLNPILEWLNGSAEDPSSLSEAIARVDERKSAAIAKLADVAERESQARRDDAPLKVFRRLALEREVALLEIAKADETLPDLGRRLDAAFAKAQKEAQREAELGIVAAHRAAFEKYCALLTELAATDREQTEIRIRGRVVLGDTRANMLLPTFAYMGMVTSEHVLQWIDRNARDLRQSAASDQAPGIVSRPAAPALRPAAPQRLPHERPKLTDSQQEVSLALGERMPLSRQPRQIDDSPLEPSQARVRVFRSGFSPSDDRPQCVAGDIVRMPLGAAKRAADAAAVEILEVYGESNPTLTVTGKPGDASQESAQ